MLTWADAVDCASALAHVHAMSVHGSYTTLVAATSMSAGEALTTISRWFALLSSAPSTLATSAVASELLAAVALATTSIPSAFASSAWSRLDGSGQTAEVSVEGALKAICCRTIVPCCALSKHADDKLGTLCAEPAFSNATDCTAHCSDSMGSSGSDFIARG